MLFMLSGPVLLVLLAVYLWFTYGRRRTTGFLPDFAKLLDRPEFVDSFANRVSKRSFLKGEFRGRKVVIVVQLHANGEDEHTLVVSMETRATVTMDTYDFAGYKADRDGELALFALEAKLEFVLRHEDGCLKATWAPTSWSAYPFFPGPFEPAKWQSVLEAMHTLAGSLERRAA